MFEIKTPLLFGATALAEIAGCYLPYLWLREGKSIWLWSVEGIKPTTWDIVGSLVAVAGMAIIMFAPRGV